jgi:aldehyde dehydrogenase (NAD+)
VSFTGSIETGRKVAAACSSATPMKKFQLEMGGKNPFVVLDDADLTIAVDCAMNGAYFSTGQRCTAAPDRDRGHPRSLRRRAHRSTEEARCR